MTPAQHAFIDELTARAREGDAEALGALFGQLRPLLVRIAQREIGRGHARLDADDLASEVMLRLIERLREGQGPAGNPVAYLARAIRNRVIDLRRAPAMRDVGVDDFAALADAYVRVEAADEHRSIDVADELEVVTTAMDRLRPRQRALLTAVAVEGMKPREIAAATGESANAVAAATSRARRALRVEIRRAMLEAEGSHACAAHRAALAVEGTPAAAAREHLDECERCQRALARFAALPALAVLVPLAVLAQMVRGASSAQAAAGGAAVGERTARVEARRAASRSRRAARVVVATALGLLVLVGVVAAVVLSHQRAREAAEGGGSPGPVVTEPSGVAASDPPGAAASDPSGAAASDPIATAEGPTRANPASVAIDVAVGVGATTIAIEVRLEPGATVDAVRVALPATMRIVDAGEWRCPTSAGGGRCTPPSPTSGRAALVVEAVEPGSEVVGEATVDVAVVADAATVTASSTGVVRVAP